MLNDATLPTLLGLLDAYSTAHKYMKSGDLLTLPQSRSKIPLRPLDRYEHPRRTNLARWASTK
jgi:hypothetical protein